MHLALFARHGIQGLFGQGQQLGRMQGQLTADDLLGHLLDQLQQLLAALQFEFAEKGMQLFAGLLQRPTGLLEGLTTLGPAFFETLPQTGLAALVEALAAPGLLALQQAFLVPLLDAFLEATGNSSLQGCRIAIPVAARLTATARRKAVWPPTAALAPDYLDAHGLALTQSSVHGTTATAGRRRPPFHVLHP